MPKTLGLIVLALAVGCGGRDTTTAPVAAEATLATGTVTVEVMLVGEVKTVQIDGVEQGTTVEALMRRIEDPNVQINGSATTAFVHTIGDVATSGREGWTFKIDGEFSHEGAGLAILHPPTTVSWRFGDFSPPAE
jgi:hypothetical protein